MTALRFLVLLLLVVPLGACSPNAFREPFQSGATLRVLAIEPFLADIAQNVAGERLHIAALIPAGLDPHTFEPTPADLAHISESQVLIMNGAGLEVWIAEVLQNAGGERIVIAASAGLVSRPVQDENSESGKSLEGDPHFWLDPTLTIRYVQNIRDGLSQADPAGKEIFTRNAEAYIAQLTDLDSWIKQQVEQIPLDRRLLVTNHESLGYFADRYGFKVIGAVLPSTSTAAAPSAQQMVLLVEQIRSSGAPAIFIETGSNPEIAQQIALETGARLVTNLASHSLPDSNEESTTYLALIRHNVLLIVDALK